MPDVQANIILNTTGGDDSAAALKKASDGIDNITSSASAMQTKFQERFQHIGLQLFAGQALGSIGLSGEVRQAVMLMNTALTGAEAAAGVASGGLTLLLTALVAVGAAIYEVVEKHKSLLDAIQKTHDAQQAQTKETQSAILALDTYAAAGGRLTPAMESWRDSLTKLNAEQVKLQILTDKASIALLNESIAQMEASKSSLTAMQSMELFAATILKSVGANQMASTEITKVAKSLDDQSLALLKNETEVANLKEEIEALQKGYGATADAGVAGAMKELEGRKKAEAGIKASIDAEHAHERQVMDDRISNFMKGQQTMVKANEQALQQQERAVKQYATEAGRDFGNLVNKMVFDNETFGQAFKEMMTQLTEQFINWIAIQGAKWLVEKLYETEVQQSATEAQTASIAGGASANVEIWTAMTTTMVAEWEILKAAIMSNPYTAASEPAAASATYTADSGVAGGVSSAGRAAIGGSFFADTPTLALFGEGGPEMATFTPMSGSGGSSSSAGGGSGDTYNIQLVMNANGITDPDTLARVMGQKLSQMIRGQGQISLARS